MTVEDLTHVETDDDLDELMDVLRMAVAGQETRLLPRLRPQGFDDVVSLDEIHALLDGFDLSPGLVDLARDQEPLPKQDYVRHGELDRAALAREHAAGATIILRAAHRWLPGLRDLCVATEAAFGVAAQANIYLTPPRNQSTPPHWDTHDLLILQVAGTKNWRLFDSTHPFPLDDQRYDAQAYGLGDLREEVVLAPGDALFLPRGGIHEPRSLSYSVHVALGVHVTRLVDLLTSTLRHASVSDASLRAMVPMPSHVATERELVATADRLIRALPPGDFAAPARAAVLTHLRDFLDARLLPRGDITDPPDSTVTARTPVVLGRRCYLVTHTGEDGRRHLTWSGGELAIPPGLTPVADALAAARPFCCAELDVDQALGTALLELLALDGLVSVLG